ncbi:Transcriptional regulator, TetR family [Actinokineospora spheciospongiae]|uniref:Transcriptional regulator, TetR family n=1 Tax=Actinokineospora spheciospongiae TaxID=909613 RepID=W7IX57_9PSEU|nr:TetR/AcrR family transcriptional regulator [Actinokineospora spheciospongiae]EWC61031.1 Transcriptional regulator, TetR family [Actinokineospora spheciospongiae]
MAANASGSPRSRMTVEQRRDQLLRIGARLLADRPYDEVWVDQVAELAQVSRGLLYHYFPTKRDFATAIIQTEADRMPAMTEPDPALPVAEQLVAGLDAYFRYAEDNEAGYRALHGGAALADEKVRAILAANHTRQEDWVVDALHPGGGAPVALRVAVRGWMAFIVAVCLDWLRERALTRDEARDLCARALFRLTGLPG